jgi:NADPH:quinone reductase-like Zn-dependent oxidoreductase
VLQVKGVYGRKPALPAIAGLEGLGLVDAVGKGVSGFAIGQRVVPLGVQGTWADYVVTTADNLVAIPDGLSDEAAAQVIVNPLTAWIMAVEELQLGPGDWLVQTAAGSVVGRCLIQIAKLRGYKTLNLVRRPEQVAELLSEGADAVLCTEDPKWMDQAQSIVGAKGAAAGVDSVGGNLGGAVAMLLKRDGILLVYGALSMDPLKVAGGQLIFRTLTIRGFWLTDWKIRTPKYERDAIIGALLEAMAKGQISPPVEAVFPLAEFQAAIEKADEPGRRGKVLLAN